MKNIKAIVFDMDGVIFDSERCIIECWEKVAEKYGFTGIKEVCYECTGTNAATTRQIMLDHYGEDFPYEEYKQESSGMFHKMYDGGKLPTKPGIKELLEHLKSKGYKIGLASSTRRENVVMELRDAGLIDYFEHLICGDMVERSKPDPDIYLKACKALDVEPAEAVAIEDSFNGIRSAYAGGLHPIMIPDQIPPDSEMSEKAERIEKSLFDLMEIF
jgi:HAD superfamily hydrolase (TIGR01509 family)